MYTRFAFRHTRHTVFSLLMFCSLRAANITGQYRVENIWGRQVVGNQTKKNSLSSLKLHGEKLPAWPLQSLDFANRALFPWTGTPFDLRCLNPAKPPTDHWTVHLQPVLRHRMSHHQPVDQRQQVQSVTPNEPPSASGTTGYGKQCSGLSCILYYISVSLANELRFCSLQSVFQSLRTCSWPRGHFSKSLTLAWRIKLLVLALRLVNNCMGYNVIG